MPLGGSGAHSGSNLTAPGLASPGRMKDGSSVLAIVRSPLGVSHPKLEELQHQGLSSFQSPAGAPDRLRCAPSSPLASPLSELTKSPIPVSPMRLRSAAAHAFQAANPIGTFCYISGAGTDSTEHGARMWARVKGRTENTLLALGRTYMFRPGFIRPVKGVHSKTAWYNLLYSLLAPVSPVLRRWFPWSRNHDRGARSGPDSALASKVSPSG